MSVYSQMRNRLEAFMPKSAHWLCRWDRPIRQPWRENLLTKAIAWLLLITQDWTFLMESIWQLTFGDLRSNHSLRFCAIRLRQDFIRLREGRCQIGKLLEVIERFLWVPLCFLHLFVNEIIKDSWSLKFIAFRLWKISLSLEVLALLGNHLFAWLPVRKIFDVPQRIRFSCLRVGLRT